MTQTASANTTIVVEIANLKNDITGDFINDATVEAVVTKGCEKTPVGGIPNPLPMDYVSGSDGTYRGTIPSTAALEEFTTYCVDISMQSSGGVAAEWSCQLFIDDGDCC